MEQMKMLEMPQPSGTELKKFGISLVESKNLDAVQLMRLYAVWHAASHGQVTIEDVREWAATQNVKLTHHNAYGAVFAHGNRFTRIGFAASKVPSAHGRMISVWALKKDDEHAV